MNGQCAGGRYAHSLHLEKHSTYVRLGKFDSARDEVLYDMEMSEWACESDGNVEAPTGAFAYIEILPQDLREVVDAFREELRVMVESRESFGDLVGWFMLYHDDQGRFDVVEYDSLSDVRHAFRDLQDRYSAWEMDDEI